MEAAQAGLLLDEWTEIIPVKEQTVGLAFQYDAPGSEPPQALLLAVTPEITGAWVWSDLVDTVRETFQMAKNRAVEPRLIDRLLLQKRRPCGRACGACRQRSRSAKEARPIRRTAVRRNLPKINSTG